MNKRTNSLCWPTKAKPSERMINVTYIQTCIRVVQAKFNLWCTSKKSLKCLVVTVLVAVVIVMYFMETKDISLKDQLPESNVQQRFKNRMISRAGIEKVVGTKHGDNNAINRNTNTAIHEQQDIKADAISRSSNTETSDIHQLDTDIDKDGFEPFCEEEMNRDKYLLWADTFTDFTDWSFSKRRKCPKFVISNEIKNKPRIKYSLHCYEGGAQLIPSKTTSSSDVDVVNSNDACLHKFIDSCCCKDNDVPNVIHYVWYFQKGMKFDTFLSILSVIRFVRPCVIAFHGEYLPFGTYWDYIIRLYPNIIRVNTSRPTTIYGKKIHHHEHSGDVMRINALLSYGGTYLDADVIALRDLKPLRKYDVTMCQQAGGYFLLNCFIMSRANATFLTLWLEGYKQDYNNDSYTYNSMEYNNELSRKYPNLIHVENGTMCCPDEFLGVDFRSPMIYNWTKLYGFHIYSRQIHFPWNVDLIRNFNTTFGSMLRHVVYGNKDLCL